VYGAVLYQQEAHRIVVLRSEAVVALINCSL